MAENNDRAVRMLTAALNLEKKGRAFYEEASTTCGNPLGREIFQMLMKDEVVHMDRIRKIYESLNAGEPWSTAWKEMKVKNRDLRKLFKEWTTRHGGAAGADAGDIEALDVGIDLEGKAVSFYQDHLVGAKDKIECAFIELMIAEERHHYKALTDMKQYLSDPDAWFLESERGAMDGA